MNKSKLAVGLMTAVLSVGALAGCDNTVKYSSDGTILTYKDGNGQDHKVTADDLFIDYYNDSTKYQSIFDSIYSIVVKNYFTIDDSTTYQGQTIPLGKGQMPQINEDARVKVEADKNTAQTNADNNGTSYDKEFEAILSSKGVDTEEKLTEKYVEELQKEKFDENFYKYFIDDIKKGKKLESEAELDTQLWTGYFKDMLPYHVSHVLVKLEDGSGTNYSNGTISEDNAKKLFNVVEALENKNGEDTFRTIAKRFSEDTGSAANYGDLGIMDYSTGYVNEFKLGIYAYENFVGNYKEQASADTSKIKVPNKDSYLEAVGKSFGLTSATDIPEIPYSVFKELKDYSEKVKDGEDEAVLEDSANFYPRNIIYNKYLNRHSVAFITDTAETAEIDNHATGFKAYTSGALSGKNVLSVKVANEWTPILVTRAGSDYQGIHFIVVNRSPFAGEGADKVVDGVTLNDYYTTFYPDQKGYPVDENQSPLKTYINFTSSETADTKSRAESLKSTLKSFDSDRLNKYIFRKYFEKEKITITDATLADALDKWIDRGLVKKEDETKEAWEKTWRDYVDTLQKQNDERTKLVSEACKIGYAHANDSKLLNDEEYKVDGVTLYDRMAEFLTKEGHAADIEKYLGSASNPKKVSDLFKVKGGLCNDGKAHL